MHNANVRVHTAHAGWWVFARWAGGQGVRVGSLDWRCIAAVKVDRASSAARAVLRMQGFISWFLKPECVVRRLRRLLHEGAVRVHRSSPLASGAAVPRGHSYPVRHLWDGCAATRLSAHSTVSHPTQSAPCRTAVPCGCMVLPVTSQAWRLRDRFL